MCIVTLSGRKTDILSLHPAPDLIASPLEAGSRVFHGKGFVDKLHVLIQNTMMGDHIGRSVNQPEHADNNEITGNDIIQ